MRYSESKRAIFFVSATAGVSRWQYGSSPGTGFQQPVGCSCGCPRKWLSADYRRCTAPETAAVTMTTVPATTTPTVSKVEAACEGLSTAPVACAKAFSAEQIEIVKQHYGIADTDAALDTCQWLTDDKIAGLRQGESSESDAKL